MSGADEKKPPTAAERIRQAEERKAEKAKREAAAREEQHATDVEAIEVLEEKLGVKIHVSKHVKQFTPGLPVIVGVRAPDAAEYKRMFSQVNRTGGNGDAKVAAHQMLAQACWVYPAASEVREAMLEANAGLLASIGNFATRLAEPEIAEEGKD